MKSVKACSERIVWEISKAIKDEVKIQLCDADTFKDPDIIDNNLVECSELCDKLLTYDYFRDSEEILNKAAEEKTFDNYEKLRKQWERLYNKELKEKQKDLKRLFDLIVTSSEDWC